MKIVNVSEMHLIEQRCFDKGISASQLMEKAGLGVAQKAREFLGDVHGEPILILVGSGNNGGDGLVSACHLNDWGANVSVYLTLKRKGNDERIQEVIDKDIDVYCAADDDGYTALKANLSKSTLVIDAILGTGKSRPVVGALDEIIQLVQQAKRERSYLGILSVDIPSGLDADTGKFDGSCLTADVTVALGYPKTGFFCFPGATKVGKLEVVDIGIPDSCTDGISKNLITPAWVNKMLPIRRMDSHKGTFGSVLVVAGSERYIGAARLACESALRTGAGLVTLAVPKGIQHLFTSGLAEVTYLPLPGSENLNVEEASALIMAEAAKYTVILAGCGLGQGDEQSQLLRRIFLGNPFANIPVVLDADALNIMAKIPEWWVQMGNDVVVTPHPGEMSRLTSYSIADINADRLGIAMEASALWGKSVILKGPYTVVSSPQGEIKVSPFVNPGLASAGTGDVLAGVVAGLIAQGLSSFDAAVAAVYIHGAVGEYLKIEIGTRPGTTEANKYLSVKRSLSTRSPTNITSYYRK